VWGFNIEMIKLKFIWFYFSLPTDVQAEAIPMILGGGDVLMVGRECLLPNWLNI
jgi:hypothetical protein